jgi:hypothetical protein
LKKPIINTAASIRQRLLNLARERNEDFGLVLTKYGLERVLFRIANSKHTTVFILKGALLFELWTEQRYRPTRDADFLARGQNSVERFIGIFQEICTIDAEDDGLRFDPATVTAERITEDADYEGIRVKFIGYLENARIPIQIDLGFGDVITPAPVETEFPTLLSMAAPVLLTYPRESVIAEKFESLVSLGLTNSRMKDLHDIRSLAREFSFAGNSLLQAIRKTFENRGTKLTAGAPVVFTAEFFDDSSKKKQWAAFCNRNKTYVEAVSLQTVCADIAAFLGPILEALEGKKPLPKTWKDGSWHGAV